MIVLMLLVFSAKVRIKPADSNLLNANYPQMGIGMVEMPIPICG